MPALPTSIRKGKKLAVEDMLKLNRPRRPSGPAAKASSPRVRKRSEAQLSE